MKPGRASGIFSLPLAILIILGGALILALLFYTSWQQVNQKVEGILRDQFNQQQLMLARKIADNVESYFDFLENALLGYAGLFQTAPPGEDFLETSLSERFDRHKRFGILAIRRYNPEGVLIQVFSSTLGSAPPGLPLPDAYLEWAKAPAHRGRLLLSKTYRCANPPCEGQLVMRFLTPLYWPGPEAQFAGVLDLLIDPFFVAQKVTADVRSGQTGYAWIIDQDETFLAHYEKDFVGHNALQIRIARNPQIVFRGLKELDAALLSGKEGVTEYDSGWHRQKFGQMPKLAAYTPVRFNKGLITGLTDLEDPAHNLWGVCVVAPVEEVSGNVGAVLHQELFLVGLFFLVLLIGSGGFIAVAMNWNKTMAREVELKTKELIESQERLVHSERFAAVGEAAAYVSHEIKNPLMAIGGLAHQVEKHLGEDPASQEKMRIIQEEVKRLENFLWELRDFTRPVAPVRESLDLNEVIHEVQSVMEQQAEEKGIVIEDRLDPHVPKIEADHNQLKQVLVNLVKNALEATQADGRISIATGRQDEQVWFSIHDTGRGMPPEVLDKIFHPFFTTKEKGTGLGLAVIHKIITDHHGTVTVESAAGQGSTFTVRLPLRG